MPHDPLRRGTLQVVGLTTAAAMTGLLAFLVVRGIEISLEDPDPLPFLGLMLIDLLLGTAALVLLPFALTRAPFGAGLAVVAMASLSVLAFPAGCLALIEIAALRRPRELATAVAVFTAAIAVDLLLFPDPEVSPWAAGALGLAMLLVLVLIGLNRGARRALVLSLRHEAESARREHGIREEKARLAERTRIAREMHDTLAHRLSLVSMHAGALEYRTDLDPETIRSTARTLRETAHKASEELRAVLNVLREEAAEAVPQPDVQSIPALVDAARSVGTQVDLSIDPALRDPEAHGLADATSRHLYRTVQECLTNARKHAPGSPVSVVLAGRPGRGISVTVSNPLTSPPARASGGMGLVGLAERARLSGGSLESGPENGSYTTTVRVPW